MICIVHLIVKTGCRIYFALEKVKPFTSCGSWKQLYSKTNLPCHAVQGVFCWRGTQAKLTVEATCTQYLWSCPLWPLTTQGSFQMGSYKSLSRWVFGEAAWQAGRRCSLWQDALLTQGLAWQNGRPVWALSLDGRANLQHTCRHYSRAVIQ